MPTHPKSSYTALLIVAIVMALAIIFLMRPANDEPTTKLGKAAEEISEGVEDAARELDPNRSTGEKIGDAIEDVGEDIQDASDGE